MAATHRPERLVPFTDAVVAIAMTLLILPLVDIGTDAANHGMDQTVAELLPYLQRSIAPLIGFVISFLVIARLWWAHHAIFEHVESWTTGMVVANVFWLLTIVLLPWVTVYSTVFRSNWLVALLYVGTMTGSSALQTLMARLVVRAEAEPDVPSLQLYYGNLTTLVAFAIALVLSVALPWTNEAPLILLAFTGLVDKRVHRRLAARAPSGAAE